MSLFSKWKTFRARNASAGLASTVANLFGHRRRRWAFEHQRRVHIELRALDSDEFEYFANESHARLDNLEGVEFVRVNGIAGRMVVSIRKALVTPQQVVDIVEAIETEQGIDQRPFDDERHYPADAAPTLRKAVTIASDAVGGTLGLFLDVIGYKRSSVEFDLAALITLIDNSPRLREPLEKRFGKDAVETGIGSLNAYAQALGSGPIGPYVDMIFQSTKYRALDARSNAWRRREPELCGVGAHGTSDAPDVPPRPVELPSGPIEEYAEEAWFASLGGFVVGLADTHDLESATSPLFSGLPKAAKYGRDGFRAELLRVLSDRDIVTVNPAALERLDRIDTVVIEGELLLTGGLRLGRIEPLDGFEELDVRRAAHQLFEPDDPLVHRANDAWTLGPLEQLDAPHDDEAAERVRELTDTSGPLLGLVCRDDGIERLAAIIPTRRASDPAAKNLLNAARDAGLEVILAMTDAEAAASFGPDEILEVEGPRVGTCVRELQSNGHGVAVIASQSVEALACADVGIGIPRGDSDHFWAADIVCRDDLSQAAFVLDACEAATNVSERAVMLAGVGAILGAFVSLSGLEKTEPGHVMLAVNASSVTSLAAGVGAAIALDNKTRPSVSERTPWHRMSVDEVLERAGSDPQGLDAQCAHDRARAPEQETSDRRRFARAVGEEVMNPLTPVLAGAAAVSAVVGSMGDAGMVGAAIGVNALVGGIERYNAEKAVAQLETREQERISVLREGCREKIDVAELVCGDLVCVEAGDVISADCRILEAESLEVDESSLTGESLPVPKSAEPSYSAAIAERSSMLYEGTSVAAGSAKAVVVDIGSDTEARRGVLAGANRERLDRTGVEARLAQLTDITLPVSSISGVLVFLVGMMRKQDIHELVDVGVGLAVASVPEGLPLLSTIAQLAVARRLSDRGILVRNPRAVEGLGRVDIICADKTGTLTRGVLKLDSVSDGSTLQGFQEGIEDWQREILAAALRASPLKRDDDELPHPTDEAIVTGITDLEVTRASGDASWQQRSVMPFEPGRSFHATLGACSDRHIIAVKGAPEVVIERCTQHRKGNEVHDLGDEHRADLFDLAETYASEGLRVLAIAEKPADADANLEDEITDGLTFLGYLALSDPIRPTSKQAVARLAEAGIDVVMITGDHPSTSRRIGEELGLMNDDRVLTGPDIERMSDTELDELLPEVRVIARATPHHKVRIVEAFQRLNRVVAMTGDGANDASAIRLADVGIALGRDATSAAREASDVILLEPKLETLVEAIAEGRAMWGSVRDAVSVLIGGNLGEIGFTFLSSVLGSRPSFNARQLLLVNLLTDIAPAIAMAVRPPTDEALEAFLGSGPEETLGESLDRDVNMRAAVTAGGGTLAWMGAKLVRAGHDKASTTALLSLIGSQLAQTVTAGKLTPTVLAASVGSGAVLLGLVETPGVSQVFGCRPVGPVCLGIAFGSSATAALTARASVPLIGKWREWRGTDRD